MSIGSSCKIFSLIIECTCVWQKPSVILVKYSTLQITDPFCLLAWFIIFISNHFPHLWGNEKPYILQKFLMHQISQGLGISDSHFSHIYVPSSITLLPPNLHHPIANMYDVFYPLYFIHTEILFQVSLKLFYFPLFCLFEVYLFLIYVFILNYEFISKLISFF